MNYALLDDDIVFHQKFKEMTKDYISYDNCSFYTTSQAFFNDLLLKENWHLDVLFLDIELNDESGIDIARRLYSYYPSIVVIFITNKNHMVYDAFGLNVFKFIYKPMFSSKVASLFQSIIDEFELIKPIKIKAEDNYISLSKKEIVLVSLELRKIYFYTVDGKVYKSNLHGINESLSLLNSSLFVQINRSEIVNLAYITEIKGAKLRINKLKKDYYVSQDKLIEIRKKWREYYV